ncbi:unnamed protein product [Peniophora sp. CBMAI 1063]|nr:unnamed protein product [Peniophora sp. CBMAI 1063]
MSQQERPQADPGLPVAKSHSTFFYAHETQSPDELMGELELDPRQVRLESIQSRLRASGCSEEDLTDERFLCHPYVDTAKPLTDEEWRLLAPILAEDIQHIRAWRQYHRNELYNLFVQTYTSVILERIPVHLQPFAPSAHTVWFHRSQTLSATLFEEAGNVQIQDSLVNAIHECIPMLTPWFTRRASQFATLIPTAWLTPYDQWVPLPDGINGPGSFLDAFTAAAVRYDFASYVFRCRGVSTDPGSEGTWHFGLDPLACDHCNIKDPDTGAVIGLHDIQPDHEGHEIVTNLVQRLVVPNLDKLDLPPYCNQTTPAFLDSLGITFFCETCTWADYGWAMAQDLIPLDAKVMGIARDWRAMVEHIRHTNHCLGWAQFCNIRWATRLENHYVDAQLMRKRAFSKHVPYSGADEKDRHWGCYRCDRGSVDIAGAVSDRWHKRPWYTLEEVELHIRRVHKLGEPREGYDYVWDRRVEHEGRIAHDVPIENQGVSGDLEQPSGRVILWANIRRLQMEALQALDMT